MHLTTLKPQDSKYTEASLSLMNKTIQLFRSNMSRPLTKENCEALMGTALLVNYISWFDLGFLDDDSTSKLDLARDQLFFLTPGIVQLWFQSMPIFIEQGSIFTDLTRHSPRLKIEEALVKRGVDSEHFVKLFMDIWDDPRYQHKTSPGTKSTTEPTSCAWRLLLGLQMELPHCSPVASPEPSMCEIKNGQDKLAHLKDIVTGITSRYTSPDHPVTSVVVSLQSDRSVFETAVRRISPLLYCAALKSTSNTILPDITSLKGDIEQLIFGFPILCCGPLASLINEGDVRALVFLCHLYRAGRVLLPRERCWWAYRRCCVMERLILEVLEARDLGTDLFI
ncbi:hypothetical protein F53441_11478 [Fusarium austroafricanum]|uniref:C6 transcription factor n=1 Tax=Fusarium austroafricanum TaxID=2364996 RepID=A0A8H4K630_9HYPO|nr:hypothetical protein F53441_11478 [Fusarium austroafricanum]